VAAKKDGKDGFDAVDAAILFAKRGSLTGVATIAAIILAICLFFFLLFIIIDAKSSASNCGTISSAGGNNNTEIVFDYLEGLPELTPYQAAGIAANLSYESGGSSTLSILVDNPDPNSGATGIAHWLGQRLLNLKNHVFAGPISQEDKRRSWKDINYEVDYLWDELRNNPAASGNALARVRHATNIADATTVFEAAFERAGPAGVASIPKRISTAVKILQKYGGGVSSTPLDPFSCDGPDITGDASASAIKTAADQLNTMHVPYNYGGGHMDPAKPGPGQDGPFDGLDCSSSVSWVLQHAGLKIHTMVSGAFADWRSWGGKPGPGKFITIFANGGHVFMKIGNRYFGTSGFGHPEAGGGAAWFTRPVSEGYLSGFTQVHPAGL
jgi:cell wall-associated NlpC family hydrolase